MEAGRYKEVEYVKEAIDTKLPKLLISEQDIFFCLFLCCTLQQFLRRLKTYERRIVLGGNSESVETRL